jgi:hypothetical protein
MNSVSASGGGDIPEAVHEGLEVKKLRGIARSTLKILWKIANFRMDTNN